MTEYSILNALPTLETSKAPAILVSVDHTRGSTPRNTGAMMWVSATETMDSIGGGQLEYQAIAYARELLGDHTFTSKQPIRHRYVLAATKGQCCGGVITLRFDALPSRLKRDTHYSYKQLLSTKTSNTPQYFQVMLFGAGHVGQALVKALIPLPFQIMWIDNRPNMFGCFSSDQHDNLTMFESDCPEAEVTEAQPGAAFVVMTHSHALDRTIGEAILRQNNYRYFGLIGSKSKRQQFERYWLAKSIATPKTLATMRCPIGIDGIKGKAPAIIAASVASELLHVYSSGVYNTIV